MSLKSLSLSFTEAEECDKYGCDEDGEEEEEDEDDEDEEDSLIPFFSLKVFGLLGNTSRSGREVSKVSAPLFLFRFFAFVATGGGRKRGSTSVIAASSIQGMN